MKSSKHVVVGRTRSGEFSISSMPTTPFSSCCSSRYNSATASEVSKSRRDGASMDSDEDTRLEAVMASDVKRRSTNNTPTLVRIWQIVSRDMVSGCFVSSRKG